MMGASLSLADNGNSIQLSFPENCIVRQPLYVELIPNNDNNNDEEPVQISPSVATEPKPSSTIASKPNLLPPSSHPQSPYNNKSLSSHPSNPYNNQTPSSRPPKLDNNKPPSSHPLKPDNNQSPFTQPKQDNNHTPFNMNSNNNQSPFTPSLKPEYNQPPFNIKQDNNKPIVSVAEEIKELTRKLAVLKSMYHVNRICVKFRQHGYHLPFFHKVDLESQSIHKVLNINYIYLQV